MTMSALGRISLTANLVLAAVVTVLLMQTQRHPPALSPPGRLRSGSAPVAAPAASGLTPDAVAQMERFGIARATLVNVLLEDLHRGSDQRLAALQRQYAPRPVPKKALHAFARAEDAEQITALKAAFGEAGYQAWDQQQTLKELNAARPPGDEFPLTAEEAAQAYRLQKDFDLRAKDLQEALEEGVADGADAAALSAQAQQALDQKLTALLGEERFNELRGNVDPATQVYRDFGDLNPSPDQAHAVVQADRDFRASEAALADSLAQNPAAPEAVAARVAALNAARDEQLRQIFGPDAYASYKSAHDPTYQTIQQYAGAWNLSGDQAQQVYATVSAFQQQAAALRTAAALTQQSGQNVDWRAVNAAIAAMGQQTEATLESAVGAGRAQRFRQNGLLESPGPSG